MNWPEARAAITAWCGSMVLWLVFTASLEPSSLWMGAAVATVAALANAVVRRHLPRNKAWPRGVWPQAVKAALRLPVVAVVDTVRAFTVLAQAELARQWPPAPTVRVPAAPRDEPEAAVVDLVVTLGANSTPNTVVLGRTDDGRHLLVHQLVARRAGSPDDLFRP